MITILAKICCYFVFSLSAKPPLSSERGLRQLFYTQKTKNIQHLLTGRCWHRPLHCLDKLSNSTLVRGCGCPVGTFDEVKSTDRADRRLWLKKLFSKAHLVRGAVAKSDWGVVFEKNEHAVTETQPIYRRGRCLHRPECYLTIKTIW